MMKTNMISFSKRVTRELLREQKEMLNMWLLYHFFTGENIVQNGYMLKPASHKIWAVVLFSNTWEDMGLASNW